MTRGFVTDLTGQRFGMLVAIARHRSTGKSGRTSYTCKCDCGVEKEILHGNLRHGASTSCGCHRLNVLRTVNISHGKSHKPTWLSWRAMRDRCTRVSCKDYVNYGARGIAVCDRWLNSFEDFLADMGDRPKGKTLERKKNHLGYSATNCVWATPLEQGNNKRNNRFIQHAGKRLTLAQWARRIGISPQGLSHRLKRWPVERALNEN